jgi:hypothetical protein
MAPFLECTVAEHLLYVFVESGFHMFRMTSQHRRTWFMVHALHVISRVGILGCWPCLFLCMYPHVCLKSCGKSFWCWRLFVISVIVLGVVHHTGRGSRS